MRHGVGAHGGYGLVIILSLVGVTVFLVLIVLLLSRLGYGAKTGTGNEGQRDDGVPLDRQLLDVLRERKQPTTQSEICRNFESDAHAVDEVIKRLENDGLVERFWDPQHGDYRLRVVEGP